MTGQRASGDTLQTLSGEYVFAVQLLKDGSTRYYSGKELAETIGTVRALKEASSALGSKASLTEKKRSELDSKFTDHAGAKNPHGLSKADLDLDQVENLGPAPIDVQANGLALSADVFNFVTKNFLTKDAIFPMQSVVLGQEAGYYGGKLGASVLIGARAGRGGLAEFHDYVAIGADTHPLASNTVAIGDSDDIFTSARDMVIRADKRDVKVVGDLDLGLDFILKLKPVLAKLDLREDYIDRAKMPLPPQECPLPPQPPRGDEKNPIFHKEWVAYREAVAAWDILNTRYQNALNDWRRQYREWLKQNNISYIKKDGTHVQDDVQAMLLADDAANAADILEKVFTGVVDFKQLGGLDVKGMRMSEMIPVLVKGIQDIHDYVHSEGFVDRVVAKMLTKGTTGMKALRHAAQAHKNQQLEDAQEAAAAAESNAAAQDTKD